MTLNFSGKVLMIGFGSVARCTLPLLLKHTAISPEKITILESIDYRDKLRDFLSQGVNFVQAQITKENLAETLSKYLQPGDLLIDLAWSIDCCTLLQWCYDHQVKYINTSVEIWDINELTEQHHAEHTLYSRQMAIRELARSFGDNKGPTAILDHGANPGLVSHFVKQGLIEIAEKILVNKTENKRQVLLERALADKQFAELAHLTGTKVIHISERDTQILSQPKRENEFVNTWSVMGLYEEAVAPAELGWGTHEKTMPKGAHLHSEGPGNQICLSQMGMDTLVRSWTPCGEIIGMLIRHGEAFTLSDYLTVMDNDAVVYRPTVHYAYCPADCVISSLHELRMRQFVLQQQQRIATDEIIAGRDELGTLLMGHDFNAWWVGSVLDIDTARKLAPGQNATTLQVACSIVSAILWALKNPNEGIKVPDELPYDEILQVAKPYLGDFISQAVDWSPLKNKRPDFLNYADKPRDDSDPWQFVNFLY